MAKELNSKLVHYMKENVLVWKLDLMAQLSMLNTPTQFATIYLSMKFFFFPNRKRLPLSFLEKLQKYFWGENFFHKQKRALSNSHLFCAHVMK